MRPRGIVILLTLLAVAPAARPAAAQGGPKAPGGPLYQKLCSQCHGEKGDGRGVAAAHLQPRPRDFTAGKFKVRHTPSGALPTDAAHAPLKTYVDTQPRLHITASTRSW